MLWKREYAIRTKIALTIFYKNITGRFLLLLNAHTHILEFTSHFTIPLNCVHGHVCVLVPQYPNITISLLLLLVSAIVNIYNKNNSNKLMCGHDKLWWLVIVFLLLLRRRLLINYFTFYLVSVYVRLSFIHSFVSNLFGHFVWNETKSRTNVLALHLFVSIRLGCFCWCLLSIVCSEGGNQLTLGHIVFDDIRDVVNYILYIGSLHGIGGPTDQPANELPTVAFETNL